MVAAQHGFADWAALQRHVTGLRDSGEPFARAYRAVEAHDLDALGALLTRFPELTAARGTNGNDLLGMASATCDERLVRLLLDHGANVANANAHGWTALHQAAYSNLPVMAEMLLDAGARIDVSARGEGGTPLVIALFWGNRATAELLAERGVEPVNLRTAAGLGLVEEIATAAGAAARVLPPAQRLPRLAAAPMTRRRRSTKPSPGRRVTTGWRRSTRWPPAAPRWTATSTAARRSPGPPRAVASPPSGTWSRAGSIRAHAARSAGPTTARA